MLWPTAMRTTTGDTVQRPASASTPFFSALTRTVALPTLPSIATAGQVFAPAPRTPTASAEPSSGGGVLFSSRFEAYMTLLLTARTQALTRSASQHNVFAGQEAAAHQLGRLVLYAGDQVDPLLLRAAQLAGIQHLRLLQTVAGDRQLPPSPPPLPPSSRVGTTDDIEVVHHYNYTVDVTRLQARLMEDVAAGLYPMMVVGTFGSGLSGAVDPLAALGAFCTKLGVWYHIDASHGGPALLASGRRADPSPPSPISASGQSRWRAFAAEFEDAACIADSLLLPAGGSALPYSTVPGSSIHLNGGRGLAGAALLFVAHVRKVAWAVQSLGESRQSTFNQHVTPGVSDSDVLRLGSLAHSCGWFAELAAAATATAMHGGGRTRKEAFHHTAAEEGSSQTSVVDNAEDALVQTTRCGAPSPLPPTDPRVHLADLVAWHQQFTSAVLHAIRSDGRFDASLDAALFGMVRLRWLTAADEATRELARAWADVLNADVRAAALKNPSEASANAAASSTARRDDSLACETSGTPPLQVYVGVVQLQRRLWVSLSFGVLPHSRAKAKEEVGYSTLGGSAGSGSREGCSCTASTKEAEEYVLHTLDLAARRVQSKGTT
ncbi:hypothetical protein ABB37_06637 [Leptomonas pyrrhocoris]|uniref:Uncharacterized protein n=1 Tax=Leptomonas pyrrhocoris TaxID=157538 RepID=A0A0M9FX03_LEPPY|nr:hypothetical protein ABB37_06637 [Leptomonas pyrrhocoris]KPA77820.1 hypothetical protein ABB37_06637 [Leptomonas pyrrhocoris]|eukprot:XP_015656259.1 hypothetical protein ABB37_06637 [Leptomonas pyrrhocoris]